VHLLHNALAALGDRFEHIALLDRLGFPDNSQTDDVKADIRMKFDKQEHMLDVKVIDTTCPSWNKSPP
jgi:hypothetical protein